MDIGKVIEFLKKFYCYFIHYRYYFDYYNLRKNFKIIKFILKTLTNNMTHRTHFLLTTFNNTLNLSQLLVVSCLSSFTYAEQTRDLSLNISCVFFSSSLFLFCYCLKINSKMLLVNIPTKQR